MSRVQGWLRTKAPQALPLLSPELMSLIRRWVNRVAWRYPLFGGGFYHCSKLLAAGTISQSTIFRFHIAHGANRKMIWKWQLAVSGRPGFSGSYGCNEFSVSRSAAFSLLFKLRAIVAPARPPIVNDTMIASASSSIMAVFLEKRRFVMDYFNKPFKPYSGRLMRNF